MVMILEVEGVEASVSNVLHWRKDLGWTSREHTTVKVYAM